MGERRTDLRLLVAVALVAGAVSSACAHQTDSSADSPRRDPVPAEYEALYQTLSGWMTEFEARNNARVRNEAQSPVWGAHLLAADANRGAVLLAPGTLGGAELTIERFKRMGVEGISLVIGYPMLLPGFPDADAYVNFYVQIAEAVRSRGMKLLVEQNVLFLNSTFTPLKYDLSGLTFDALVEGQQQMAQVIIDRLKPDYLTIMHEPQTFAVLAGVEDFYAPERTADYVTKLMAGLDRHDTRVGGGGGNWDDLAYSRLLAATDLDYVSLHVYPINPGSIDRAYAIADIAEAAGKELVVTEAWLYKANGLDEASQSNLQGWEIGFRRDVFGFWEPLDARFVAALACFSRNTNTAYVSPFWTNYMFAYVEHNEESAKQSYKDLVTVRAPAKVGQSVVAGNMTETGRRYRGVIANKFNCN